jgi:hypothetical protein
MLSRIIHNLIDVGIQNTVPESDTASCQASLLTQAVRDLVTERLSNVSHQKSGFCGLFIDYAKAIRSLGEGR